MTTSAPSPWGALVSTPCHSRENGNPGAAQEILLPRQGQRGRYSLAFAAPRLRAVRNPESEQYGRLSLYPGCTLNRTLPLDATLDSRLRGNDMDG